MKNNKLGLVIVTLLFSGGFYFLLSSGKYVEIMNRFLELEKLWLLCAFLSIVFYWLIEAKIINNLIIKLEGKQRYRDAFKVSMIGQFFSGITPFSTGGQPAQLVLLTKQKIPVGKGSSVLMNKFVVYQGTLVIYSALLLLLKAEMFIKNIDNLFLLVILGFGVNACVIGILLFFSMSRKTNLGMAEKLIALLAKFKLIKDKNRSIDNFKLHIEEFHEHVIILLEHKTLLYQTILMTVIQLTLYFLIPYFIYRSFGLYGVEVVDIVAATAFVLMITSFIPMPGGSVGAEGGFYLIFGLFFLSKYILSAVVIWRVLTYYIWILVGGVWMITTKALQPET